MAEGGMLGDWMRREMESRRLTLAEVAAAVPGWSVSTASKTQMGTRPMRAHELLALLEFFGYEVPDLNRDVEPLTPQQRLSQATRALDITQSLTLLAFLESLPRPK